MMDRSITLRFYQVTRTAAHRPQLADVLQQIAAIPVGERWRSIGNGIRVRLERFAVENGDLTGEFTREQNDNYPSLVHNEGVAALPIEQGIGELGHGVAFRFRPPNTLAIQFHPVALSPSKVLEYIYAFEPQSEYHMVVRLSGNEWQRFADKPLRKLEFSIASPTDLTDIENAASSAIGAIRQLAGDYQVPQLKISLGMGHRGGALSGAVKELARTLFEKLGSGEADVRSLKAVADNGYGGGSDEINLVDEIVSHRSELAYRKNDPDYNYELRHNLLGATLPIYL